MNRPFRRYMLDSFMLVALTGLLVSNTVLGAVAGAEIERQQSLESSALSDHASLLGDPPSDSGSESTVDTLKNRKKQLSKREGSVESLPAFNDIAAGASRKGVADILREPDFFESNKLSADSGRSPPTV